MFAVVAFALALAWLGVVKATPTNITILDQSPMITYFPSRSGPATQTWNVTYDETPWSEYFPGALANGTSTHSTYFIGATATFGFRGTAVYVIGSGADFAVSLNGAITPGGGQEGMLFSKTGMQNQWWEAVVKVTGSGGVAIESITFTVEIGNPDGVLSAKDIQALTPQNTVNPALSFSGEWKAGTVANADLVPYARVMSNAGGARVVLPAVSEETFIILYGGVNYDHETIRVESSGPAAGWGGSADYNGNSPYLSLEQVQWFGMADWGVVSVQIMEEGKWFDLSRIHLVTASGGTPVADSNGSGLRVGVIVGIAVGAGAFLVICAVVFWLCYRKRKRETKYHSPNHPDSNVPYEIDPYTETTVAAPNSGHFDSPEMAYAMASGVSSTAKSPHSRTSFGTLPISAMPGLTPYPPHSPGMSEGSSGQPSWNLGTSSASNTSLNRYSKSSRSAPAPDNQVRQEVDAGRMVVPPSYDPTWAHDHPGTAVERSPVTGDQEVDSAALQGDGMKQQLRTGAAGQ